MRTEAIIRKANQRDIPAIVAIGRELLNFHQAIDALFTPAENFAAVFGRFVEENIRNDAACVLVAVVDGKIVGYCQGMLDRHPATIAVPDYGQILDFAVTAKHRGIGLGKQMFAALREWFRKEGMHRIEVRHSTSNEIAAQFWSQMGFKPYLQTLFTEL